MGRAGHRGTRQVGPAVLELTLETSGLARAQELMRKFPLLLRQALLKANVQSAGHILTRIKRIKLVGGNPLNRRTGNLIRSWSVIPPVGDGDGWKGGVGSNADYAAAHELGVDKTQNVAVRAHTRKVTQVYGRPVSGVTAYVDAFTRAQHTKLPARPYARPAFVEEAERIRAVHHDQIRQAWEKAK